MTDTEVLKELDYVYRVARRIAHRDDDEYLSAAHEALLMAAESYNPDRGTFHTWAGVCAKNACLNVLKQHKRHILQNNRFWDKVPEKPEIGLHSALMRVTTYRDILCAYYIDGSSIAQLMHNFNLSKRTALKQLRIGKQLLQRRMDDIA